ncbi:hypothetical protein [Aquisalimonas asiatica]|uniref:Uncharacterized protein n=1 Tax=Aquisalimonas asiatica TaxID=406100 RepID=A0A1H8PM89_9GAMM|nr:hypothetical protein [Aquisalimonas asiatica]SEO42814.1 hypothetical protein SAMN04488052_10129 [Aquisalimonas asiatica]
MKVKIIAGLAAVLVSQAAFAGNTSVDQRLIDLGFMPERMESTNIVRTVPAEPESRTEALLVEWGFKRQPVERVLQTEQRVVGEQRFDNPTEERLVEWGFLPQKGRNVSTLVGAGGERESDPSS